MLQALFGVQTVSGTVLRVIWVAGARHFHPYGWDERDHVAVVDPWGIREVNGSCPACWRWDVEQWGQPVAEWGLRRLVSVAQELGHPRVDLVKLDCEGVENSAQFVADLLALGPEQIVLEQHPSRPNWADPHHATPSPATTPV